MIKLKHLKTSRTIHDLPLELWYIHSHLNAPRHGYLRETDTYILEKLTGTQISLLIESFWVWRLGVDNIQGKQITRMFTALPSLSLTSTWLGMRDIALPSHRKKEYEVKDENLRGPKPRSVRLQLSIPSSDVHVGESPVESSNNVVAAVHQYLNLPDIESLRN
ncbi:hypothetical protein DY000_02041690 [Brassica cretica]|uniref:Uncharacterized protein n=1 Tax=Brassica cretica TaxID=69181 RepID=A0ABQ7BH51_BRACR|nr:hypothetical protein DY000_02041690 [Brassica cretica]